MMTLNQLKSIHTWIRNTNTSEIIFVSALILPNYLLMYNYAIVSIKQELKDWVMIVGFSLFVIGVLWMKVSQSNNEKNEKDLIVIKNYIIDKGFKFISFEKLKELDDKFTESRIRELMFIFPNDIRLAKLKGNKKGVKILNIEEE